MIPGQMPQGLYDPSHEDTLCVGFICDQLEEAGRYDEFYATPS